MTALRSNLLPIVVIDDPDRARPLADALVAAGVTQVEVTLRTPAALDCLAAMAGNDDLLVGVGTARTAVDVTRAVGAGARFVVSPGLADDVVDECRRLDVDVLPGIATPTELLRATGLGLSAVKLFPAAQLGGAPFLAALSAVFPEVRFVPTGGIGLQDLRTYLDHPAVEAVGGSWMVPPRLIADGDFAAIQALCAEALERAA